MFIKRIFNHRHALILRHKSSLVDPLPGGPLLDNTKRSPSILFINTADDMIKTSKLWQNEFQKIGFVPTMGALHQGHLTLVQKALEKCDKVIVSIFVNPSQFAPHEDLDKYPKTMEQDLKSLISLNKDQRVAAFVPKIQEVYPSGITTNIEQQYGAFVTIQGLSHMLEGSVRPHFFRGVATVVTKLLNMTRPDVLFLGQKDAQQCVVLKQLIKDLRFPTEVEIVATQRETDGLAKSSRNVYLNQQERQMAPILYRALSSGKQLYDADKRVNAKDILNNSQQIINQTAQSSCGLVTLEYLSINHPANLALILDSIPKQTGAIFSGAIRVGNTRIIDNILLGSSVKEWSKL